MKYWKDFTKQTIFISIIFILFQGQLMAAKLKNLEHNNTTIPVIFEKHKTLPIFNLQLVFQNSGYINDKKVSGLTNITSKILNEGTLKDGSVKFARKLENKAISIHSNTGFETFVIEVSCLKSEYKDALKYLKQILTNPNLTQKTLDKIKNLQVSKLKQKENDFDYVASKNLKSLIYPDTPLSNPRSGTIKDIEKITLEDVKTNLSNILNLDNLIIAVGGDIKYKEFKDDIKPIIKNIKANGKTEIKKFTFKDTECSKIEKKETQQAYIYFASPFKIEANSEDNYKLKVASFILGGSGFGSRLMEEIRVKHGLAYSAYGSIVNKKSNSNFTGYLQTKLDNMEKAKDLVEKIVKEFVKNGVTQKELDAAKRFLSGSEPLRTETFSQRLNRAFMLYYNGLSFNHPKKELEKINNLTLKELNDFIMSHPEIMKLSYSIVTK